MFRVREIALVTGLFVIGGIFQQVACVKHNGGSLMAAPSPPKTDDSLTYLALGDSYTIGQSVAVGDRYPVQVVQRLRTDRIPYSPPDIIAVTGWTTADLLAAMPARTPGRTYHVVSLLIGVNNQYQHLSQDEYRTQFTELLQQSIQLAGNRPSHVLVLSIPDYSVTPFARGTNTAYIAAQLDSFNSINKEVSLAYQVHYVDVTGESRQAAHDPSLIASDDLHFSGKEYAVWASLMEPIMKDLH